MANMLNFEQNHEEIKEDVIEVDVEKRDDLTLMIQTPVNSNPVNKRAISKIDNMEVDEEVSNKRIKIQSQGEVVMRDEQSLSDSGKSILLQQKPVQM